MRCLAAAFTLTALLALGGCNAQRQTQASMGMLADQPQVLSLGAGDALGRAVYVNDLILAAAALDDSTTYTNVDAGAVELLVGR